VYDTIAKLDDYYSVYIQPFEVETSAGSLTVDGAAVEAAPMSFTAGGDVTGTLVPAANLGCDAADFPAEISGQIALVPRGSCNFSQKVLNAKAAGALGIVVYNNDPAEGVLHGTLGEEGDYIPVVGISLAAGEALLPGGQTAEINVKLETITTYNVIAETLDGDHDNVIHLGAHSDSVADGPGINDNGSGSVGILEVALQLTKYQVTNAVRFSWWAAEEVGLLGALNFVETATEEELAKIKVYLNFDMIASPNYVYALYDGDGSAFNVSGPAGSAQLEHLWEDYFHNIAKLPTVPTAFDGRSDYGPFLDVGIASGGLFTGAEEIKTAEEARLFGGEAGVAYDINYHGAGDNITNINAKAFYENTKAIAHSVAILGKSTTILDAPAKRDVSTFQAKQLQYAGGVARW
jgi:Zn-dependent M28 family amino/carboxypeptidase